MRKFISILFALVLVVSFSLMTAVPAAANGATLTLTVPDNVYRPSEFVASSTTTNSGASYTNVRFNIIVSGPVDFTGDRANTFTITKVNGNPDTEGINNTFTLVGGDWVGYWGPATGFPLSDPYDDTSTFTIQMTVTTAPVGNYEVTVELDDLNNGMLATATDSFTLSADTLYVGTTEYQYQFTTIQDAIDAALAGDTINVAAGTYTEQLIVDKSLTLQAGSTPTIDVSGFTGNGILVTANNVTIDGFEIIGIPYDGSGSSNVNPTIAAEANYVAVQNCVFNTSGGALGKEAMVARPGTNHINFLDNEVNNYMFGITARGSAWGGSATLPGDGVTDLTVSGNTFNVGFVDTGTSITGEAVQIHYGDNIVVTGNTINGPGTFESCTYDLINSIGITDFMSGYGAAGTITYSNNEVTNCYVGIGTFAGNGEISANTVTGNNIGIQVGQNDDVYISTPATGVAITGNDIQNNIRGIWAQNFVVDGLAAHFNNIVGNTEYGIINEDPENNIFDATHNWWGDASGPYHATTNTGGTGDSVSDYVDYDPWLTAELAECESECICGCGCCSDTPTGGNVTIDATGDHTITTAKYTGDPCGTPTFEASGNYYDVCLCDDTGVNSLTIQFCEDVTPDTVIYYWDETSSSWEPCSDQYHSNGCVVVIIDTTTSPSLSDLTGTPFAEGIPYPAPTPPAPAPSGGPVGGDVYPVSKAGVLAPWIGLAMLLIGGGILVWRRRTTH